MGGQLTSLCYRQPNILNKKWWADAPQRCVFFQTAMRHLVNEATLTKDTLKLKRALKPPCPPSQDCFPPGLEWRRSGASRAKQDESGIKSLCNLYAKGGACRPAVLPAEKIMRCQEEGLFIRVSVTAHLHNPNDIFLRLSGMGDNCLLQAAFTQFIDRHELLYKRTYCSLAANNLT